MGLFNQLTFAGLSVRGFRTSLSIGPTTPSMLTIELAQDTLNGDFPIWDASPPINAPCYFNFYGFTFNGLLQRWLRKGDYQGDPVYEATLVDPREILLGTQLIIGAYNGASPLANLQNVFGWWENNFGFGSSGANESGMSWNLILEALAELCNTPAESEFGGPLQFGGFTYGLDLSELPVTPDFYRIGGVSVSLLEAISQVCDDGACDFFVDLVGSTIRVRTISRFNQPPLGTISSLAGEFYGSSLIRSESGVEARNEVTSAFLIGGDVTSLNFSTNFVSFWGYDVNGDPITGTPAVVELKDKNGNLLQAVACEAMNLSGEGIEDVIGSLVYPCTTLEMRLALENYNSWSAYVAGFRPDVFQLIFAPVIQAQAGRGQAVPHAFINDGRVAALKLANEALASDFHAKAMRLYEHVKRHATDYYGKQFLVAIPFILTKQDPETLVITYSLQPTDAGWFDEDLVPGGLPVEKADVLQVEDGRYRCFAEYDIGINQNLPENLAIDFSRITPGDTVTGDGVLFMNAQLEAGILQLPTPYVLVRLPGAVYEQAVDVSGDTALTTAVLQGNQADVQNLVDKSAFGNLGVKIWPAAVYPSAFAIPLKSNTQTYGPWWAGGASGQIRVEQDPSLVPWNYGGIDGMDAAGAARVVNAFSLMNVSEAGVLELAGPPTASPGDILQANGPTVTNIDVAFSTQGVVTTYRMQTFTPRFGVFSKATIERMRRLALTNQQLKRALRQVINGYIEKVEATQAADAVQRGFMANAPKAIKKESPHPTLFSYSFQDSNGDVRTSVSSATYEETIAGVAETIVATSLNDGNYLGSAAMSLTGLVRPFATVPGSGNWMPTLSPPDNTLNFPGILSSATLNPFQQNNDVEVYAYGPKYQGMHAYRRGATQDARVMALRGPLMLEGWGWDIQGNPQPSGTNPPGQYMTNYLRRSDAWKVGPVDHLWDPSRGVWTSHDLVQGVTQADIPAGDVGNLTVYSDADVTNLVLEVANYSDATIPAGTNIGAGYLPHSNTWMAMPFNGGGGTPYGLDCAQAVVPAQAVVSSSALNLPFGGATLYQAPVGTNPNILFLNSSLLEFPVAGHYLVSVTLGWEVGNFPSNVVSAICNFFDVSMGNISIADTRSCVSSTWTGGPVTLWQPLGSFVFYSGGGHTSGAFTIRVFQDTGGTVFVQAFISVVRLS